MRTLQPIVGRGRELERIDDALAVLEDGRPGFIEFVGEPGIGKTRLLRELGVRAEERGRLALSGLAAEFERDVPFGLIVDALDGYLAAASAREAERWAGPHLPELAGILPSLRELVPEPAPALPGERYKAHRALRALLEGIAATRPLVLSLDDLQWADEASLELVATLLRRPPNAAVVTAIAYRSATASAVLASARRVAELEGSLETLELGPLSDEEATELLDLETDMSKAESVVIEAGGNPFFLTELARAKEVKQSSGPRRAANGGIPASVTAALDEELGGLGETEIAFLRSAAVAGEPFEPDLAAEIAELPVDQGLDVLDRLVATGIVRPTDVPRRFLFRHPLVRRAVYEGAPAGWRLAAHGRAAEALAKRGADAAQRAHHVEHSATVGDADAVDVLQRAALEVADRAPASAARWLQAALRLLPGDDGDPGRRNELMGLLATSQAATGRLLESEETILELIRTLPDDAGPVRMRLIATCAVLKDLTGRHDEARKGLLQYTDEFSEGSADSITLLTELALNAFWGTDYEGARDWARRGLESAGSLDDTVLRATAAAVLAYTDALIGDVEAANLHRSEAAAMLDQSADEALARRLNSLGHLGWTEYHLGHLDASRAHFERARAIARTSRQELFLTPVQMGQAFTLAGLGRLAEAREVAEEIVESARLVGNTQALGQGLTSVCLWATLEGDLDAASRATEEALAASNALGNTVLRVFAATAVGEYRVHAGEHRAAVEVLLDGFGGIEMSRVAPVWVPIFGEVLVRAALADDDRETAQAVCDRIADHASALGLETALGHARRCEAALLLADDQPGPAHEAALSAAAHDEKAGTPVELARDHLLAGQALTALGDSDGAAEALRAAESLFSSCGAARMRDQAVRELRRLGKRTRRAPRRPGKAGEGLDSLSGREREIADLVTDRKTNREIAEELVLSEKTIEAHLRNVFAKLGVSSRVDVARAVEHERAT